MHMANLTLKNLDDWIYARLRQRAQTHRRSIVAEATVILEQALAAPPLNEVERLEKAQALRKASSAYIASHEAFEQRLEEGRP